jgi:protein-L-isoaspartate(D-aspartate) O-methyltransferase
LRIHYENDSYAVRMVEQQIKARGITDENVCSVMAKIPRILFVSGVPKENAYDDHPISIGSGQTISQPYIVALMTELLELRASDKVLEIGTGSGYQTAILAELGREVYTVERIESLIKRAEMTLSSLGYTNIFYLNDDGSKGWDKHAPYDKIIVTAAAPNVPENLKKQLADNGKIVIPVGDYKTYQVLYVITRVGNFFDKRESIGCRFVPLVGENAFSGSP